MAKSNPLGSNSPETGASADGIGEQPEVKSGTLDSDNRVIKDVEQAIAVAETLMRDAKTLIKNSARITNKKQGARPYRQSVLNEQGRKWMPNISSGAFSTELRKAAPRLYMPLLTASTLTSSKLPTGWVDGEAKTEFFRETITETIRSWPKWGMFVRSLAKEVVDYGFAFAVWTDPYEWRPHLVRMDRGFVPRGSEIMDSELPFFLLKWEYRPDELLQIARQAADAGVEGWNKEAVATAVEESATPAAERSEGGYRKWEELIKEQVYDYSYTKGSRVVKCQHLFVLENTGKISQYLLYPEGKGDERMLMEREDAYESMSDVVAPLIFELGDGTIHGSWGAGHMLYEAADTLDKSRCDMIANLKLGQKIRLQVEAGKSAKDVKLVINSDMILAEGGAFAQSVGSIAASTESFILQDGQITKWMQERLGAYLPPMPTGSTAATAAQVTASQQQDQEIQKDVLEFWLMQAALMIATCTRRMMDPSSNDDVAVATRKRLLGDKEWYKKLYRAAKEFVASTLGINVQVSAKLSDDELDILVNQPSINSVTDFTPFAAAQRAQFAAAVKGDTRFDQVKAAKIWAAGVPGGGQRLAEYLVIADGDTTIVTAAQRQQLIENTSMLMGIDIPVVATDMDWVHMQTMKPAFAAALQGGQDSMAAVGLKHYAAHYAAGVAKKTIPPDQVNAEKSYIADIEKAINSIKQQKQQAAILAHQQALQQNTDLKRKLLAGGAGAVPMAPGAPDQPGAPVLSPPAIPPTPNVGPAAATGVAPGVPMA